MLVVFQMPPHTPPTHTVFPVGSAISTHTAFILPEVMPLPGRGFPLLGPVASLLEPLSTQVSGVRAVLEDVELGTIFFKASVSKTACHILSCGTVPVAGSIFLLYSNAAAAPGISYLSVSPSSPNSFSVLFLQPGKTIMVITTQNKKTIHLE